MLNSQTQSCGLHFQLHARVECDVGLFWYATGPDHSCWCGGLVYLSSGAMSASHLWSSGGHTESVRSACLTVFPTKSNPHLTAPLLLLLLFYVRVFTPFVMVSPLYWPRAMPRSIRLPQMQSPQAGKHRLCAPH